MTYKFKEPKTVKQRAYQKARAMGHKPKKARKIAADLNRAVIEAHDHLVEIDRQSVLTVLRGELMHKKASHVRKETGITLTTLARLKHDRVEDYKPHATTLHSLARYLDMEIVAKKKGRGPNVVPIRMG